jgi:hypothetical protein
MKTIRHSIFLALLAISASGCFSSRLVDKTRLTTRSTFEPTVLYQATNNENLAMAGFIHTNVQPGDGWSANYRREDNVLQYLVFPGAKTLAGLPDQKAERGAYFWLDNNNKRLSQFTTTSNFYLTLPSGYEKVTDLSQWSPTLHIQGSERQSNSGKKALLPLTVVADVVTLPIQIIGYVIVMAGYAVTGGH